MERNFSLDYLHGFKPITYSTTALRDIKEHLETLKERKYEPLFEDSYLTSKFLKEFIVSNHQLELININYKDIEESLFGIPKEKHIYVLNSMQSQKYVFGKEFKFNLDDILKAHTLLMDGIIQNNGEGAHPELGYREKEVYLSSKFGKDYSGFEPSTIQENLQELLNYLRIDDKKKIPFHEVIQKAIVFYFNFERIHPFNDGNGRIGRILLLRLFTNFETYPIIFDYKKRVKHMASFDKTLFWGNKTTFSNFFIKQYRDWLFRQIKEAA